MVGIGSRRSDRYRVLETLQAMVERRRGGETGVRSVQLVAGQAVWRAGSSGRWSRELLQAAVARSDSLQGETLKDGRPRDLVNSGELPRLVEQPEACLVDYSDGLRARGADAQRSRGGLSRLRPACATFPRWHRLRSCFPRNPTVPVRPAWLPELRT